MARDPDLFGEVVDLSEGAPDLFDETGRPAVRLDGRGGAAAAGDPELQAMLKESLRDDGDLDRDLESLYGATGCTQTVSLLDEEARRPDPHGLAGPPGARIRRLRTKDHLGSRIGDVGRGRLLDDLAVGRPARLAVDTGPALVTSPLRQIAQLSPRCIQLHTANSVYQLELIG